MKTGVKYDLCALRAGKGDLILGGRTHISTDIYRIDTVGKGDLLGMSGGKLCTLLRCEMLAVAVNTRKNIESVLGFQIKGNAW